MCGRYYFVLDETGEGKYIKKLCEQFSIFQFEQGEIFPSQEVLALIQMDDKCIPKVFSWGIKMRNHLLINARSETIAEKAIFKNMLKHRCVIPCNGFYEWKKSGSQKHKFMIKKQNQEVMYLAALYDENQHLVILTGESDKEMKHIHQRTPLLLDHNKMQKYLNYTEDANVDNDNLSIFEADIIRQTSLFNE